MSHSEYLKCPLSPLACMQLWRRLRHWSWYVIVNNAVAFQTKHQTRPNLQVYGHVNPAQSPALMARMADCITRIGAWTASNRLCLNPAKTEVIWLGSTRRLTHVHCRLA